MIVPSKLLQHRWWGVRSLACAIVIAYGPVSYGQTPNLKLSAGSVARGANVTLPLTFTGNGALVRAVEWTLAFSTDDFTNITVAAGSAASGAGKSVKCASIGSGRFKCVIYGLNTANIGNGTLATATLTASTSTTAGSSTIQVVDTRGATGTGTAVAASGTGSAITITGASSGISAFTCDPNPVTALGSSRCTATLAQPAGSGGLRVSLGWTASGVTVTMPSSIIIPSGARTGSFTVQFGAITGTRSVVLAASANGSSRSFTISVVTGTGISVSVSPSSASLLAGQRQQFSATVNGTSNTAVVWSISPQIGTISSTGLYTAPASIASQQTVTVRATSAANTTRYGTATITLRPPIISGQPISFWGSNMVPSRLSDSDIAGIVLGLKFYSDVNGVVRGVRFYKSSENRGTHVGELWTATGRRLAVVTFTNETASGWQQANFSTPVSIQANTTYVISYYAPNGRYSVNENYFGSRIDRGPLHIPAGASGVFRYGSSGSFPTYTYRASNYWVDVVFTPNP